MGLFQKNQVAVDKNAPEYAVSRFGMARSNLLLAIVFTVINIVLELIGADTYFLFSLSFPYYEFSTESAIGVVLPALALAFYVVCYVFSKKKPGFMIAAMIAFILDCLYLVGFSFMVQAATAGEVGFADFIMDYLFHVWVLVYLIIGVRYCRRYRAAISAPPQPAPFAAYPAAPYPPVAPGHVPQPQATPEAVPQTVPEVVDEIVPEPVDATPAENE